MYMKKFLKIILIILGILYFIASILIFIDYVKDEKIVSEAYTTPGCAEHFMVPINK